jgi:hypothetical protein
MLLRRLFRSPTVGSIADWYSLWQLVASFFAGGALLSWAASSIEPVMRYGWGAAFFLGLISMCVIIVIASIGLIAWRFYKPLKSDQTVSPSHQPAVEEDANRAASEADFEARLHSVEGQARIIFDILEQFQQKTGSALSRIDELLKPNIGRLTLLGRLGDQSPPPKNKFESLEKDIKRVSDNLDGARDEIVRMIEGLKGQINSIDRQASTNYEILSTSLRARDAKETIDRADTVVMQLGAKLAKAEEYLDDLDWGAAYDQWYKALDQIDNLLGQWTEHHKPFLAINHRDYENAQFVSPPHIVSKSDTNRVRYKNVWIAHPQYVNRRDNVLAYFASKTSDLP